MRRSQVVSSPRSDAPLSAPESKVAVALGSDPDAAVAAPGASANQREFVSDVAHALPSSAHDIHDAHFGASVDRSVVSRVTAELAGIDEWRAEQELRDLRRRITGERRELALTTPRRQRLILLSWISRARAYQEILPDEPAVDEAVESIARMLSGLARVFWPGSVRALQLSTRPIDAVRELRSLRFVSADTWAEVAALAAEAIENARLEDQSAGRDAFGWADASRLVPSPGQPELMLAELTHEVEDLGGRLGSVPPEEVIPAADQMLVWVRKLRWLRGTVEDAERWGAVAGRMRYWVYKHRRELAAAERELNPEYSPEQSWSGVFDRATMQARRAAEVDRVTTIQLRDRDIDELISHLPPDGPADRAALLETLTHLLRFSDTHHDRVVEAMRSYAEQIKGFTPDDLPAGDRRLRRRLDKLKRALDPTDMSIPPDSVELEPQAPDSEAEDEVSAHWSIPSGVRDRVVPFTRGKRALFITNRNDSELQERLQTLLELESLDLAEGEERRVDAAVKSITASAYDLVLGATGFMNHKSDERISRACRKAGINYVRVDRGRPLTCLLALAKNYGVELENIAQRVAANPRAAG
ncbi:MAG TPA: hypothetical protein VK524_25265 [Polyangiaceae bacterium]|nr:hypothetical protein [Polyangiaceae bacterium]